MLLLECGRGIPVSVSAVPQYAIDQVWSLYYYGYARGGFNRVQVVQTVRVYNRNAHNNKRFSSYSKWRDNVSFGHTTLTV